MGLAERRAAKQFEDDVLPGLYKDIQAAAGFALPVEVAWEGLLAEGYEQMYSEAWTKVYFKPLIAALKNINVDDMGRDALQAGLTKIVICNTKGNYSGSTFATFDGGVLVLDHEPISNVDDIKDRTQGIQRVLEAGL